ncbi:restriction endonuclease subunit S [Microbacterium maritypicum]
MTGLFPSLAVKRVADVTLGKMLQSSPTSDQDTLAQYMRAAHIQPGGKIVNLDDQSMWFTARELQSLQLKAQDVVMVEGGAGYGRSAYLAADLDGWGFQNSILRVRRDPERAVGAFIYYALTAALDDGQIAAACNQATFAHFTAEKVAAFEIPVPALAYQQAIVDFLDQETAEIDAFIADQEELIGLLTERRAATITHAVIKGLDPSVPMKDSGVEWLGKVPSHWTTRPLWSMFQRVKDIAHPEEPMLSVFREHGVVLKDQHENLNKTAENRNIYQLVGPGWLVANRMKAWQGSVGISSHRGIVSGHYICFAPRHDNSDEYLNYLFRSRPYAAGYTSLSRGVRIGQAEIDNDQYRLMPVLLPPVSEQRVIVAQVNHETAEVDAAIADAREAIALSKERRAALISAAVTGKIDVRGPA